MKKNVICAAVAASVCAAAALAVANSASMLDDPQKPWSYFVHPVTCIGMPLQTAKVGIQVTPEGTIFTGEHELALFFGDERRPLACRQRRYVDDIPIVEDEWRDGDCRYRWTLFGSTLTCDPLVSGTLRRLHETKYRCIIHSGPAGESFEHKLEPWNKRDVESCPPPHAWGNANCNTLVRNLFLFERGDDTLYVLPALCRAWLKDGEPCGILRAPTRFGEVSVTIVPDANGATLALDAQWKRTPKHIYFRIPYFVTDWKGKRSAMPPIPEAKLTPEEERTEIALSFAGVLQAWRHEYARRRGERGEPEFKPV